MTLLYINPEIKSRTKGGRRNEFYPPHIYAQVDCTRGSMPCYTISPSRFHNKHHLLS